MNNIKQKTNSKQIQEESYTYIVECEDGSLYTGWTNHLEERMQCHNDGKGAKYTRSRLPVKLVYYEVFVAKQDAMKREYSIKQLTRKDKLLLIEQQSEEMKLRCEKIMKEMVTYHNSHKRKGC